MSITERLRPFPLAIVHGGSVVFATTAPERKLMFHLLDITHEKESLLLGIATTFNEHLEKVNPRLCPMRLEFESLLNEAQVVRKLQSLLEFKYGCENSAATTLEVEASLTAIGETEHSMCADFEISIELTGMDGAEIEVAMARGLVIQDGDWAAAEAERLMYELVQQNSFAALEESKEVEADDGE